MRKELEPVFAEFGACVQVAQVLEYGLSLLIALTAKHQGKQYKRQRITEMDESDRDYTLGELFSRAREKEYFTDAEVKMVFRAISERNRMVHNYMIDNVEKLLESDGRQWLIDDIRTRRKTIESANDIVESLMNRYLEEHGTTMDELKDSAASYYHGDESYIF